jgi:hypothetical protein
MTQAAALYAIAEDLGFLLEDSSLSIEEVAQIVRDDIARSRKENRERITKLRLEVAIYSPRCPDCWHEKTSHGPHRGSECSECACGHGAHQNTYQGQGLFLRTI